MSVTPIRNPLPGEDLLGIDPELLQQVDPGWRHRLALYTGRALTDTALKSEQQYRAGRIALIGQAVTPGTVQGLEFSMDVSQPDPPIQVMPGYGITAIGEDVTLTRPLKTTLSALAVIDPQTGAVLKSFKDYAADTANNTYAGVFLLQPILAQVVGAAVDSGAGPIEVTGQLNASCDQDPEALAFEDLQIADGARLVLVAWPSSPATLNLPAANPAATWRNRLAYTVFSAELALAPDDRLPWELLGVPVALSGFDATWKPLFADRAAVVRAGGLPRRRYVLPAQEAPLLVQPALAQARISQLAEQLGQTPGVTSLAADFALLPPAGILPSAALDFSNKTNVWFPANWTLTAGPVHTEEIETVLQTGMTSAPLDVTQAETVEILVPLSDELYDPSILVTETVAPEFQDELDKATAVRAIVLQHRKDIQAEANVLAKGLAQPLIDLDAGLSDAEKAARDGAVVYTPTPAEAFGAETINNVLVSVDIRGLQDKAAAAPYTVKGANNTPLPLFSADDFNDLATNGLQHFIDRINAKISRADDLIDLAFLSSQTDIYRFRQNVLGATDASRLATSTILANIATGDTANATAADLRSYLKSILPPGAAPTAPAAPAAPASGAAPQALAARTRFAALAPASPVRPVSAITSPTLLKSAVGSPVSSSISSSLLSSITSPVGSSIASSLQKTVSLPQAVFAGVQASVNQTASVSDIQAQQPIVGAQLNIRTLTVAERLKQSPAQEGLFYAVGNRLAFLQLLLDLEITIADIPFVADAAAAVPSTNSNPIPTETHFLYELKDATKSSAILNLINGPRLNNDSDEAGLFSAGVRVLEQHTQLLRGIEARIQQYRDFVTLCTTALTNIQSDLQQAQTLLKQLENDLAQARQNLAFVTQLLADETQRVNSVNAQRIQILQNFVQFISYSRPRTLRTEADVPSRQLVPGNVTSPVPVCLQQALTVPPELREIVALLREAPVNWLPSVQALLNRLDRPSILQEVAVSTQARATLQLQLPQRTSSADGEQGVYAPVITNIYTANQQVFRSFQTQRSLFQPAQLVQQSWSSQIAVLQNVTAVADLTSAESVHAEVANATSRLMQQISSVATCLYLRVGMTLPVDRLVWTEYLRGAGLSIQLRSLAVLPNWNQQAYIDRQQMQLLVDWLFLQIDTTNQAAVAFMSDVVRVAILLASHAPVNDVIAGAVLTRVKPIVGGKISLNLASDRVAQGMYVQLFRGGDLAAQAVVSDLDSTTVTATFTDVYRQDTFLEANDIAHFTAQAPQAVALRAFVT